MNSLEYFKYCCVDRRAYQRKTWILAAFSTVLPTPANEAILNETPYALHRDDNGFWFIGDDNERIEVEGSLTDPLLYRHARFTLDDTWYPNGSKVGETTIGIYLLNRVVFWETFKDLVPYENGLIDDKVCKKHIKRLMHTPDQDGNVPEGKATPKTCLKLTKQANYLLGSINVFCKPGSIEVLTVDPKVLALRDRLLKEHANELNDPIIAAKIIDEVVAYDTELQLNGPSKDFFINKNFLDNARKKMFLVFGVERNESTGEYEFITRPLAEGWDLSKITTYINTAIMASYDRGKATGDGGARVKEVIRLTSRMMVLPDDCGTTGYELVKIYKDTLSSWVGTHYWDAKGNLQLFKGDADAIGKVFKFRSPTRCLAKVPDYCKYCVGEQLGSLETQISSECQDLPTGNMLLSMKSMHLSGMVSVTPLELEDLFPVL